MQPGACVVITCLNSLLGSHFFRLENDQCLYNQCHCHLVDFILGSLAKYHQPEIFATVIISNCSNRIDWTLFYLWKSSGFCMVLVGKNLGDLSYKWGSLTNLSEGRRSMLCQLLHVKQSLETENNLPLFAIVLPSLGWNFRSLFLFTYTILWLSASPSISPLSFEVSLSVSIISVSVSICLSIYPSIPDPRSSVLGR